MDYIFEDIEEAFVAMLAGGLAAILSPRISPNKNSGGREYELVWFWRRFGNIYK